MTEDGSDQPPVDRDVFLLLDDHTHELFQVILTEIQILFIVVLQELHQNSSLSHLYLPYLDQMNNVSQILLDSILCRVALVNIHIEEHEETLEHPVPRVTH